MAEGLLHRSRIESIDLLRGVIIVIMALDHAHDFFGSLATQPTDLATTTPALFFTRWITHLCAPVFFLLAGTSAALTLRRMSKPALSRFLLTRGLWLLFLDAVVMRFALQFNFDFQVTMLVVLWALGWAMIVLAGLIWWPRWLITALGIALIAGHNALDNVDAAQFGAWAPLWHFLHQPGPLFVADGHLVFAAYVLIPWIGVTAMGYVLGAAYAWPERTRRLLLFWLGLGLVVGFVALRYANVYGDPLPWSAQRTPLFTLMSFVNTNKYPPSLLFLMMTLGPALLLLCLFERGVPSLLRPAHTIGRVPLFFYIVHFYLIHALAVIACWMRYGTVTNMFQSPDLGHFPFTEPDGWDFGLPVVYLVWILVVLSLYPLCRWFAGVRQRYTWWWLSYL